MDTIVIIRIAAYIVLVASLISSIFWVGLAYTWWKMEKKRTKKARELEM